MEQWTGAAEKEKAEENSSVNGNAWMKPIFLINIIDV